MKTNQRSFVVEYKSARRRSTPQADAIWGNMDLKTIVGEAEADAPHLFVEDPAPQVLSGMAADSQAIDDSVDPATSAPQKLPALEVEPEFPVGPTFLAGVTGTALTPVTERPVTAQTSAEATKLRRKASLNIANSRKRPAAEAGTGDAMVLVDELSALEIENGRLKALLVERLHRENLQLREMLARFHS
jgi:hypothetical protein